MQRASSRAPAARSHGTAALGLTLLACIGIVTGSVATLMPLLVSRLQGSAAVIAAILASSYLVGSVLQVVMGRLSDRFGRLVPTLVGFAIAAVCLPTLTFWAGVRALGALAVGAISFVSSLLTPTTNLVIAQDDHGPLDNPLRTA